MHTTSQRIHNITKSAKNDLRFYWLHCSHSNEGFYVFIAAWKEFGPFPCFWLLCTFSKNLNIDSQSKHLQSSVFRKCTFSLKSICLNTYWPTQRFCSLLWIMNVSSQPELHPEHIWECEMRTCGWDGREAVSSTLAVFKMTLSRYLILKHLSSNEDLFFF